MILDRLFPMLYDEIRAIARAHLRRERPDHSLGATALVHEAFLRLLPGETTDWGDRRHFFQAAAQAMRRILIERARRRLRLKRGGHRTRVELTSIDLADDHDPEELLALYDAIRRLEEKDPRAAEVVQLRFFAGLSVEETARALDVSERTVKREWTVARAWLFDALRAADHRAPEDHE